MSTLLVSHTFSAKRHSGKICTTDSSEAPQMAQASPSEGILLARLHCVGNKPLQILYAKICTLGGTSKPQTNFQSLFPSPFEHPTSSSFPSIIRWYVERIVKSPLVVQCQISLSTGQVLHNRISRIASASQGKNKARIWASRQQPQSTSMSHWPSSLVLDSVSAWLPWRSLSVESIYLPIYGSTIPNKAPQTLNNYLTGAQMLRQTSLGRDPRSASRRVLLGK